MDDVLADRDLLHLIYMQIRDEDPWVEARALTHWPTINRAARVACARDEEKVWFRFMDRAFHEWIHYAGGELALALARDGQHPRVYVKQFLNTHKDRWMFPPTGSGYEDALALFVHDRKNTPEWREWVAGLMGPAKNSGLVQLGRRHWSLLPPWTRILYNTIAFINNQRWYLENGPPEYR